MSETLANHRHVNPMYLVLFLMEPLQFAMSVLHPMLDSIQNVDQNVSVTMSVHLIEPVLQTNVLTHVLDLVDTTHDAKS